MYIMRRIFSILFLLFSGAFWYLPLEAAADKVIMEDDFRNIQLRVQNFRHPAVSGSWQKDLEIVKPAGRLYLRFFKKDSLNKVELLKSDSGKTVWQSKDFTKPQYTVSTPDGRYILRFSGKEGSECHVEVSTRSRFGRMINWKPANASVMARSNGILLQPNGKNADLRGRCFQLQKNKLYNVSLDVESMEPQRISLAVSKHKVARRVISFPLEAGKAVTVSSRYQLPDVPGTITIIFSKPLLVKKLTITEAAPEKAPLQQKMKAVAPTNDGRFLEQRNDEKEPVNPALAAPVIYRRAPRMVYPDSIPQNYEICDSLYGFGTPGSYVLFYAVLHNPATAKTVGKCTVSDLFSGKNKIVSAKWDISEIAFSNYPRGKLSSQIIPELIIEQSEKELRADGNRMFRFYLQLPENTAPGKYCGSAVFRCKDTEIRLPLNVSVLPFQLHIPRQDEFIWSIYSRIQGRPQRTYQGAVRDRYFQDMRDIGITGLHYSMHYNEGTVKRLQERRKKQGFTAPPVFYGIRAHQTALKNLGLPADDKRWFDKENVRKEYVRLMKIFDSWMKKHGGEGYNDYYVSCVDEPFLGKMDRALWENKLVRAAGIKTAATIYQPRWVELMAPDLDLSINMFINRDPGILRQLKEIQKKHPKLHYWYLGAGAYDHQEGGLMPNRLMAGFGSFRSGVSGHISFTYQNIGNAADAFRDPLIRGYGMTFPHPTPTKDKVTIFTLEWDGLREGITDYKYLYTLQKLIREKAGTPAAARGQQTLDYILRHTTWQDHMTHAQGITARRDLTNDNLDKLRALAASAITELIMEK